MHPPALPTRTDPIGLITPPRLCTLDEVPAVAREISRLLRAGSRAIVVDLADAELVDETLWSLLHRTHRRLAEVDGRLAVIVTSSIADTPAAAGLEEVLELYRSRQAGLDALSSIALPAWLGATAEQLTVVITADVDTVVVRGEWDISNVDLFRVTLDRALARESSVVVVDLSAATFIDLRIVACLRDAQRQLEADGRKLSIPTASPAVERILSLSGRPLQRAAAPTDATTPPPRSAVQ